MITVRHAPSGGRPPWLFHDGHEWLWLCSAVEPATGHRLLLLHPHRTWEGFGRFLESFVQEVGGKQVGLVCDGSGAHRVGMDADP